jgi:2-oxoisovalerate dehydrogenase E1 component
MSAPEAEAHSNGAAKTGARTRLDGIAVAPEPSADELRLAYSTGTRSRALEEHIVRLVSRGEVKFAIWGPGEEVHGTATALALSRHVGPEKFGLVPHYRSGSLCSMWCELHGMKDFSLQVLRQQFSKDTDQMSRGRQMVYHLDLREMGILPVQSPVGMQLGKAAGYAMGFKTKGVDGSLCMGIVGDGTTAEGDMHDAMNAASVWTLPVIIMVTDNGVAISTGPDSGRGIKDFAAYAAGFGVQHFTCDGRDFWDVYRTTWEAARVVKEEGRPVFMHVHSLPRFNGHSSAADVTFDLGQDDPLINFGRELVRQGVLEEADTYRRIKAEGRDFFVHHELGRVMGQADEDIRAWLDQVRSEPDPPPASVFENIRAPFPQVEEAPTAGSTQISYAGAIRAALDQIMTHHGGMMWGQDVAKLGGVMQATAGLQGRHPTRIIDAPLNEPLIVGTACGLGLHKDLVALPEVQFGDYSLNAFHWLVHMGNLYWTTNGNSNFATILRMPVDPFGGGAVYHSMSLDGYFTPIPGLVIVMPSTSWDVYGLLMTAAEYRGPVVVLEPKWMYRQTLGPALPGEPTDPAEIAVLKRRIMRGEIPEIEPGLRVPFGKAAVRRPGQHVTLVSWGRAAWTSLAAAERLASEGVDVEVIDLRTLVPPDLDTVFESVERTGRLVVAAEDRSFAGFVRTIQGAVTERFPQVPTRAIGQKDIPGIAQCLALEEATVLTESDVMVAVKGVLATPVATSSAAGWSYVPPRYFLS